jgi:hypothetical protein
MNPRDAAALLKGVPLIPAVTGSLPEIKELTAACLDADIAAVAGCPPGAGGG